MIKMTLCLKTQLTIESPIDQWKPQNHEDEIGKACCDFSRCPHHKRPCNFPQIPNFYCKQMHVLELEMGKPKHKQCKICQILTQSRAHMGLSLRSINRSVWYEANSHAILSRSICVVLSQLFCACINMSYLSTITLYHNPCLFNLNNQSWYNLTLIGRSQTFIIRLIHLNYVPRVELDFI